MFPHQVSPDYFRIRRVCSFEELVTTPWSAGVNALCWERTLPGDYAEVLKQLGGVEGIVTLDEPTLHALPLSEAGAVARAQLLADLALLRELGLSPSLDCICEYPREAEPGVVRTDVYSFHADRAPVPAATYLCTYVGAASEGLRNEEAQRWVDLPATRVALLKEYGGEDDADFRSYLEEHCFDLHYAATPLARPYSFGLGFLWRIAIAYPGCPVPPCIHRAPLTPPGEAARLLLIS